MINKRFDGYFTFNSFTEIQSERLYKNWLKWQSTDFNIKTIGSLTFLGLQSINKILCNEFYIMVIFLNDVHKCSLINTDKNLD